MPRREPDDLRSLGDRIDAARGNDAPKAGPPPSSLEIASRFGIELGVALFVGAGLGWLLLICALGAGAALLGWQTLDRWCERQLTDE